MTSNNDATDRTEIEKGTLPTSSFLRREETDKGALSAPSFYSQKFGLNRRNYAELSALGGPGGIYNGDAALYRRNSVGMSLYCAALVFCWLMLGVTMYGGLDLRDFSEPGKLITVTPFSCVILGNALLLLLASVFVSWRPCFHHLPRRSSAVMFVMSILATMCFIYLQSSDLAFYSGMAMVGMENYFWVVMLVREDDPVAQYLLPLVRERKESKTRRSATNVDVANGKNLIV